MSAVLFSQMSRRDVLAAFALAGILAARADVDEYLAEDLVRQAFAFAEVMEGVIEIECEGRKDGEEG